MFIAYIYECCAIRIPMNKPKKLLLVAIVCLFTLWSCTKDTTTVKPSSGYNMSFTHLVNGQPLQNDLVQYTNANSDEYSVTKLEYFISDFTLYKDGEDYNFSTDHYIDASVSSTLGFTLDATVEEGTYDSLSFVFGFSSAKMSSLNYVNPPASNMVWPTPLGGGFHYMKLEGKYDSLGTEKGYAFHVGPTMGNDNSFKVVLSGDPINVDQNGNFTIEVAMNIDKWFETPTTFDLDSTAGGIMMNQALQQVIQANGNDVFSLVSTN